MFAVKGTAGAKVFGDEFVKYFKVIKNCGTAVNQGCMSKNVKDRFDGTGSSNDWDSWSNYYSFITADGSSIMLYGFAEVGINCGSTIYTGTGNMANVCGVFNVDVNGPGKGPNYLGRDIFVFFMTNGKGPALYPYGGKDSTSWWQNSSHCNYGYNLGTDKSGSYCAGRIIDEGWQMTY